MFDDDFPCNKCDRRFFSENDLKKHEELEKSKCKKDRKRAEKTITLDEENEGEESEEEENDLSNNEEFAKKALEAQGKTKQKKETAKESEPKDKNKTVCSHLKKGKCFHGISGRRHHKEKTECPFYHPRVCDRLLRHGTGPRGCKTDSNCLKLHPRMCPFSLKGVCLDPKCSLGLHVQGTNTKEARAKSTANKETNQNTKPVQNRKEPRAEVAENPPLPLPALPGALGRVLGQPGPRLAATSPAPALSPVPGLGQDDVTASFLGQLLLKELLRTLQGREEIKKIKEVKEVKEVNPQPNLLQLLLKSLST